MTNQTAFPKTASPAFREKLLLFVLAAIQFTTIVDFLIIMPLGPQYVRMFHITQGQFGVIVSAYAISAGITGIAAGLFLDRFDRKRALLCLYLGFTLGTFLCALAPSYPLLVAARALTGAFGGVAGALILAIVGDVIPGERRGAAMGMLMSSFSVASICGVPIGLLLATRFNWHVAFMALAGLCVPVLVAVNMVLPALRGHLHHARDEHPLRRMLAVLGHTDHQMAFLLMAAMTSAGFLIFPFLSNYMVSNVGMTETQLPLIYLAGGAATIFSLNLIGRWADRSGKLLVFTIVSLSSTIPILALTNLPRVPLAVAIAVSTLLMVAMSGRMVPAMALMTASVEARYRGGFMSMNSSVQQFTSGLAAYCSGQIMGVSPEGKITHFSVIGVLSVACTLAGIYLARFLKTPQGSEAVDALALSGG